MSDGSVLLVVGEVFVDLTLSGQGESKMRLGGIVHAARGLWANGVSYSMAAICPKYLVDEAQAYALAHGCAEFLWLGEVIGAPNVMLIGDVQEVSSQGYEDLLRDKRHVVINSSFQLVYFKTVLVFPGRYSLAVLRAMFSAEAVFDFDIAYDVSDLSVLAPYRGNLRTISISTSSPLFLQQATLSVESFIDDLGRLGAECLLLKENRGGSRLFDLRTGKVEHIPAQLGNTVNSVGVGDAYSAVLSGLSAEMGVTEAAWRGAQTATRYAQTTYPDDLRRDVQRDAQIDVTTLQALWGTSLPWHERPKLSIYLAAPDFSYVLKPEIEQAIASLTYHNFKLRRPVQEIGELEENSSLNERRIAFSRDIELLKECDAVLAIPLDRDPGTLVEVGWALAISKPVVVFDPRKQNNNTMVVAGSTAYSSDLDDCINELFIALGQPRARVL